MISGAMQYKKKVQPVMGKQIAYIEEGEGEGEPAAMVALVESYGQWMAGNSILKLFINAEPGSMLTGTPREFCRSWPNQTEVTVAGSHFIQEDSPVDIGCAIAGWCKSL